METSPASPTLRCLKALNETPLILRRLDGTPRFRFLSQVAAKALEAAAFGAYYNVTINLKDVADEGFRASVSAVALEPASSSRRRRPDGFVVAGAEESVGAAAGSGGERGRRPPRSGGEEVTSWRGTRFCRH